MTDARREPMTRGWIRRDALRQYNDEKVSLLMLEVEVVDAKSYDTQRETIARLEGELAGKERAGAVLTEKISELHTRLTASEARIRSGTQRIIAEIGSDGPENLEDAIGRAIAKVQPIQQAQQWTRERPTVAGWYWLRYKTIGEPTIEYVYWLARTELEQPELVINTNPNRVPVAITNGMFDDCEWQGPLTPGEE